MTECRLCDKVLRPTSGALEDTVLHSNAHFICIPALGALVPGYVLLASRRHVTSIVSLSDIEISSLKQILRDLVTAPIYQNGHILFEHGTPNETGGGACIHHYHLHLVPKNDLSLSAIEKRIPMDTRRQLVPDVTSMRFQEVQGGYLLLSDGTTTVCHLSDEIPTQLIRRIIAGYLGIEDQWNWAIYPHMDRVAETIDAVRLK